MIFHNGVQIENVGIGFAENLLSIFETFREKREGTAKTLRLPQGNEKFRKKNMQ